MEFDITIEIPKSNCNKYEIDHETGRVRLNRMLFISTRYLDDHGYIDGTFGEDGDLLDALVPLEESTFPDCVTCYRALGMLRMRDEKGGDGKVLCVPNADQRASWCTDIEGVSEFHCLEIQHFFEVYKDLEPGKSVGGVHWVGCEEAEEGAHQSFRCEADWVAREGHWYAPTTRGGVAHVFRTDPTDRDWRTARSDIRGGWSIYSKAVDYLHGSGGSAVGNKRRGW